MVCFDSGRLVASSRMPSTRYSLFSLLSSGRRYGSLNVWMCRCKRNVFPTDSWTVHLFHTLFPEEMPSNHIIFYTTLHYNPCTILLFWMSYCISLLWGLCKQGISLDLGLYDNKLIWIQPEFQRNWTKNVKISKHKWMQNGLHKLFDGLNRRSISSTTTEGAAFLT